MKDSWGVFWLSFTNEIHNHCLSHWSYVRDFEQILPRLLSFFKLPLKFIKSFWNTFWIMFKGYVWCLNCLIKTFFGNRSSRVSPFSGSYSRYIICCNNEANPPPGEHSLHHNSNLLDADLAKKCIQYNLLITMVFCIWILKAWNFS